LQKIFYLNLDIDDYKKKKIEYLKYLAKDLADQVSLTKEEKVLLPMSSYERRIIHSELSQRIDVTTESRGDGFERHIVIKPK
jgi:spoIIIJ-associated protein